MEYYTRKEGRKRLSFFDLMAEMWSGPQSVELTPPPTPEENWESYGRNIAGYFRVACGRISPDMQADFDREQAMQEEILQVIKKYQRKADTEGKANGSATRQT